MVSGRPTIAVYGGSFNPPGVHHRVIVEALAKAFDRVVVIPCGPRPDKETTNDTAPIDRAVMCDLAFRDIPNCIVELGDIEQSTFATSWELFERYNSQGEAWIVVGGEFIRGGHTSSMFTNWEHGASLWNRGRVAILAGLLKDGDDQYEEFYNELPIHHRIVRVPLTHANCSTGIRQLVTSGNPSAKDFMSSRVFRYVDRHRLYRKMHGNGVTSFQLPSKCLLHIDDHNAVARQVRDMLMPKIGTECLDDAGAIISIGGDGTMLNAICTHWRHRLPFIGINTGHRGFLLNDIAEFGDLVDQFAVPLKTYRSQLLYVEMEDTTGTTSQYWAFNDVWLQCKLGTAGWMCVDVNGETGLSRVVADGVLVATAAGSTAYARAMGATPILIGTPSLVLAGSNVSEPHGWCSAHLPLDVSLRVSSLDDTSPAKRPLYGFVDGMRVSGEIREMRVRVSRISAAEIAFLPGQDLGKKLAKLQLPG